MKKYTINYVLVRSSVDHPHYDAGPFEHSLEAERAVVALLGRPDVVRASITTEEDEDGEE
jgi:hypothetical protein